MFWPHVKLHQMHPSHVFLNICLVGPSFKSNSKVFLAEYVFVSDGDHASMAAVGNLCKNVYDFPLHFLPLYLLWEGLEMCRVLTFSLRSSQGFVILHVTLLFFRQLLLYHLPHLHNQLEEAGVAPVVYATPWFITLFAYKNPLHVIMRLWHEYIRRGDPTFVPFLAVALMELEKLGSIGRDDDPCALSNVLAGFLHFLRHPS